MEQKKNEKYDLEKKRPLFFGIGMIISLSLTLVAFEWKSPVDPVFQFEEPIEDIWFIDDSRITKQKPPEIPKPQPQKKVVTPLDQIKEVEELSKEFEDDTKVIIDDIIEEIIHATPVEPEIPKEPFLIVEDMPEFPGGDAALLGFIAKNIKYPNAAKKIGIQGRVFVKFVVNTDGSITDIEVLKGIGAGCDKEAVRVLKLLPKFTPGKQRGVPVNVQMQLPINFKLQ